MVLTFFSLLLVSSRLQKGREENDKLTPSTWPIAKQITLHLQSGQQAPQPQLPHPSPPCVHEVMPNDKMTSSTLLWHVSQHSVLWISQTQINRYPHLFNDTVCLRSSCTESYQFSRSLTHTNTHTHSHTNTRTHTHTQRHTHLYLHNTQTFTYSTHTHLPI